jgi:hypothetical protein
MHIDPLRGAFGLPLPPRVGLRAVDQLFLLAVHTDHRLASGQPFTSKPVDVVELGGPAFSGQLVSGLIYATS